MDRNYIIGLVLIALVFVFWAVFMSPKQQPPQTPDIADTVSVAYVDTIQAPKIAEYPVSAPSSANSVLISTDSLPERFIKVETDLYSARLSTRGAAFVSFALKRFDYLDRNEGVELIHSDGNAVPNIRSANGQVDFGKLSFAVERDSLLLTGNSSDKLSFVCSLPSGKKITKTYTFHGDKYSVDIDLAIDGISELGLADYYNLYFERGLEPTEKNIKDDLSNFKAYAFLGADVESFDSFDKGGALHEDLDGAVDWVSIRSKYFTIAMIPTSRDASGLVLNGSRREHDEKRGVVGFTRIGSALKMRLGQRDNLTDAFTVYLGPLDYNLLLAYGNGLENTMDLGWKIIRPFSKVVTWLLIQFHTVIPNYGVVVIAFTIVIKLLLSPLSIASMKSMRKMQRIQPLMNELREKHKKDPQKMNQELMKLYKTEKINPLGGCLPMLPQIPIFFALFTVFKSTIEFRGAPFVLWMNDLSQPDHLYILPVLMAVTMFFQQKMTMHDPKQKLLIYIFPALFLWWGISFPLGLVLYWTVFNIFGFLESIFIHKRHIPPQTATATVTDARPTERSKKK
jgi:YidC/Oxa1 family membrane protein insertase